MDAIRILRQLFERRLPVAFGVLVATVLASLVAYEVQIGVPPTFKSRAYEVGVASVDILVDSGNSQVADLGGGRLRTDLASLSTRAQLLANLLAASLLKEKIAVRAGIDPRLFHARVLAASTDTAPAERSTLDATPSPRANTLTMSVRDLVPIITIDVTAADAATASRIASAATAELESYQKVAAVNQVPNARRLVLKTLGQPRSGMAVRGRRPVNGVVAFVLILAAWCAVLVVKGPIARRWREAAREEEALTADDLPADQSGSRLSLARRRPAPTVTQPASPPAELPVPPPATSPHQNPVSDVQLLRAPERPDAKPGVRARR